MKLLACLAILAGLSACGRGNSGNEHALSNGATINRADDAPGNAATAPVPMSGSGAVPPNANNNASGNSSTGNSTP